MRLKLSNGFVRVTEGDIGAQFSENVRFAIDSDMDGYVPSLLVKFQGESGDVVEALCQKDGDEFVIPSAAYRQTQVIMLTVSSAKGDEVVNSQPLYVRITEGNSGGAVILPTDEDTWKTAVKAYVDSLMVATNEKILQVEERVEVLEQSGGGGGGTGSTVTVNPILTSGTKVAEITVNGSKKEIFAPTPSADGVTESRVNELIDAKLNPIEALADDILEVL